MKTSKILTVVSSLILIAILSVGTASAQDGGGNQGGGNQGGGNQGGGNQGNQGGGNVPVPIPDTPNVNTGDLVTEGENNLDIPEFELESVIPEIENERVQPFVGPRGESITHPLSQNANAGAGGGGGGLNFRGGGAQNRNQGGAGPGFTVPRRSLRARLLNRIVVPNAASRDSDTSVRFNSRLVRIPALQNQNISGIQIAVENRKATLTGVVRNETQRQLVERMARLEPGIYSIDNQIVVANAANQ